MSKVHVNVLYQCLDYYWEVILTTNHPSILGKLSPISGVQQTLIHSVIVDLLLKTVMVAETMEVMLY